MYQCPNCGGGLRFDILSQQLKCDYCQTLVDPFAFKDTRGASEEHMTSADAGLGENTNSNSSNENPLSPDEFEVTKFICPQCGAEIISKDNTAAAFCSFCGASTVLTSRVSREKKPDAIIPFKKTKEDCVNAYSNLMRRSIFAPKELKDAKCIDGFRGIYMPYWVYDVSHKGKFYLHGTKSSRQGNYDVTKYYTISGDIDAAYQGITHDAAKEFSDDISESVAPYDVHDMKNFNASFLSGFYADTADVRPKVYSQDVSELTTSLSYDQVLSSPYVRGYSITDKNAGNVSPFREKMDGPHYSLFPVWFMSYRKGDRVAYATVNGQTGKVFADVPIDFKKYTLGSLLLALPLFIIFNFIFSLTATKVLAAAALFAMLTMVISIVELAKVSEKESGKNDRGLNNDSSDNGEKNVFVGKVKRQKSPKNLKTVNLILYIYFGFMAFSIVSAILPFILPFALIAAVVLGIIKIIPFFQTYFKSTEKKGFPGFIGSLCAVIIACVILILHPVSDYYYYGGALISAVAIFITIIGIIKDYNLLSTRKLPQFNREGGDDRVR